MKDVNQSEREDVFKFIVNELQAALPYLNEAHSNQKGEYYGRMTRPVACFLLAKLFLNVEIYTDNDWTDGSRPSGKTYRVKIGSPNSERMAGRTSVLRFDTGYGIPIILAHG